MSVSIRFHFDCSLLSLHPDVTPLLEQPSVLLGFPVSMQGNHPESYSLNYSPASPTHTIGGFNFPVPYTPPFTIKIPSPMQLRNRTSIGSAHSMASGSEYHESNASMDLDGTHEEDAEGEDEDPQPEKTYGRSMRGRRVTIAKYKESDSEADPLATAGYDEERHENGEAGVDEEEGFHSTRRRLRSRHSAVVFSSDDEESGKGRRYATRSQSKKPELPKSSPNRRLRRGPPISSSRLQLRDSRRPGLRSRRSTREEDDADGYVDLEQANDSADESMEDAVPEASSDLLVNEEDADGDIEVNGEGDDEVLPSDGKPYSLRQRAKVNYAIPPPLEEIPFAPPKPTSGRSGGGRGNWNRGGPKKGPGWSVNGTELSRFLGLPGEDSVCDICVHTVPVKLISCRIRTPQREHQEKGSVIPRSRVALAPCYLEIWLPRLARQLTSARSEMLVSPVHVHAEVIDIFAQLWQMPIHLE